MRVDVTPEEMPPAAALAMEFSESEIFPSTPPDADAAEESAQSHQHHYQPSPFESSVEPLSPRGHTLFRRGVEAHQAGETDNALEIWRRARAEFPTNGIIAHNLGLAEVEAGQYGAAIHSFSHAHRLDRALTMSSVNSVHADTWWTNYKSRAGEVLAPCKELRNTGRWEEAETLARRLLDDYPGSAAAYAEVSLNSSCRWSAGPRDDTTLLILALEYGQRSIFLDPTCADGYAAAGVAQNHLGMHREAYVSLEHMLEAQENSDSDSFLFCGEMALQASKVEGNDLALSQKALEYADRIIVQEADNLRAWNLRAQANAIGLARGVVSVPDNLADFERLLELDPDNSNALEVRDFLRAQLRDDEISSDVEPIFSEAIGYLETNETEKAVPLLRQILESEPDNRPALNNLSLALRRLKCLDEALDVQTHLAEVDDTPESWRLVASIALQLNRIDEANRASIQVAQLLPDDARAQSVVATTLEQLDRKEESIPYWRRVLELTPHDDIAWLHLGENLLEEAHAHHPVDEGVVREALSALKRAYALDTEHSGVLKQVALAHAELGESQMALDCAERLAKHDPETHASLVATLTNIHSRRLSEGLASRSADAVSLPPLIPPVLGVENAGGQGVLEAFPTVHNKSLSPLLVGIVGLVAIFGLLGVLRAFSPPSPTHLPVHWQQSAPDPSLREPTTFGGDNWPATTSVPPSPPVSQPLDNPPINGFWGGTFNGDYARLLIDNFDGNNFTGTLLIENGPSVGTKILIKGTLYGQNISWKETEVLASSGAPGWDLGNASGNLTQSGSLMHMSGSSRDSSKSYNWEFGNAVPPSASTTSAANVTSIKWARANEAGFSFDYPTNWTRTVKKQGQRMQLSYKAPQSNVSLIIDVSPSTGDATLMIVQAEDKRLQRTYGRDYQLVSLEGTSLGGEIGSLWEFILKKPGETPLRKRNRSVVHNSRSYTLLTVAPAKDFKDWLPTFSRVGASFSFQ